MGLLLALFAGAFSQSARAANRNGRAVPDRDDQDGAGGIESTKRHIGYNEIVVVSRNANRANCDVGCFLNH